MKISRNTFNTMYDPRIHGVRQSTLNRWLICRESARLSTCQCWRRIGLKEPTTYGSIMHECISISNKKYHDYSLEGVLKEVPAIVDDAVKSYKEVIKLEGAFLTTEDQDMIERSSRLIEYFFQEYLIRWWHDDHQRTWIKIEDKFQVPFKMSDGATVFLAGTYDGAFKPPTSDAIWLFETKNKRTWDGEKLSCTLPYDLQVACYLTALKRTENKVPVGCLYNILRRPGEKIGKKETLDDFAKRVTENIRSDQHKYFERISLRFTRSEVLLMEKRVEAIVQEYWDWWKKYGKGMEHDPLMNTGACDLPQRTCDMLPLCMNNENRLFTRTTHKSVNA